MNSSRTRLITLTGVLSALASILYFIEIPYPFADFLKLDLSDIPAILAGVTGGPLAAVLVELIKNLIHFMFKGNWIGEAANLIAGLSLVLPVVLVLNHTGKNHPLAYLAGAVSLTLIVNTANYFLFLPLWGIKEGALLPMITATLVPFNLIKAVIVSAVAFALYGRVRSFTAAPARSQIQ